MTKQPLKTWALFISVMIITACATQPDPDQFYDPPGFFCGLWHGFIIFFSFIVSLFTDYRIYAFPNSGGWYDLGFLLGAASSLGGAAAGSR